MTQLSKLEIAKKILAEKQRELEHWQAQLDDAIQRSRLTADVDKDIAISRSKQWDKIHRLERLMREAKDRWKKRSRELSQAVRSALKELRLAEGAGRARSTLAKKKRAVAAAEAAHDAARKRHANYVARSKKQLIIEKARTYEIPDEKFARLFPSMNEARREIDSLQQDVSNARSEVEAARTKVRALQAA